MKTTYHQPLGAERPKRGDLLQSNIGTKRERTWLILGARILRIGFCKHVGVTTQRTKLWAERWWEVEPETRMALYRSAERRGGQVRHDFYRFAAKRRPTFEQHMRRISSRDIHTRILERVLTGRRIGAE